MPLLICHLCLFEVCAAINGSAMHTREAPLDVDTLYCFQVDVTVMVRACG